MHERIFAGWAVGLLLGGGIWTAAAQDLDARKTPQQLFSANCSACHRSPQGLMKSNSASGVTSFLRQHYTSGPASASALAGYLASVGPGDPRKVRQRAEPAASPRQGAGTAAEPDQRSERYRQRAARNAERIERAARAEAAQRRASEPAGLSASRWTPRRPRGEPAVVSIDPPSVLISTDPKPVTPRTAARGQIAAPPVTAIAPAAPSTATVAPSPPAAAEPPPQARESATAALPEPSAPASNAEAPAVGVPPSAVAAEPLTASEGLPPYPPPPLDLGGVAGGPAEQSSATAKGNDAQPGFSAPLP